MYKYSELAKEIAKIHDSGRYNMLTEQYSVATELLINDIEGSSDLFDENLFLNSELYMDILAKGCGHVLSNNNTTR